MNHEYHEYFCFLDNLRESGETNMFGAAIYLEEEFDMEHGKAGQVLWAWIKGKQPSRNVEPSGFSV